MAERTGQPIEQIARDTDRDNFMIADEAVDYGLIDKVLTSRSIDAGAAQSPRPGAAH